MAKTKINGDDVLKKITPLLIKVNSKHPKYFSEYMKYNYRRERLDPQTKTNLEKDAEKLLRNLGEALGIQKTLKIYDKIY